MGFSFFNNTKDEEIKLHNSPSSPPSPSPSVLGTFILFFLGGEVI